VHRLLLVCAFVLAWPLSARAQKIVEPTETVIRLTVQPMAAPKPALKYQLLPELKEMNPGNPVQEYMKCFAEQQNFFFNKEVLEARERYQVMPLHELPLKEIRYYTSSGALKQADYAARLDTPNWQILPKLKSDGVNCLLPDIQQLRMLASALKVRFRIQVAEKRFDDALVTAKTMFALSRHLGEHPALVSNLVGIAIANVAIGPLEEMLQQPGCPNLHWALSDLPTPFISLRTGLQGERVIMQAEFADFADDRPMSEAELQSVVDRLNQTLRSSHPAVRPDFDARSWLLPMLKDEKHVEAARDRLVEFGLAKAKVKSFPALQAVLLDEKRAFEIHLDEETKWMKFPYWQAEAHLMDSADARERDRAARLLNELLPFKTKVTRAQARLEQRIALLQHVEAIRLYAADHDGKFPASLEDITVPLPVDPFTGQPFKYSVDGPLAEVRGTPPRGEQNNAAYKVRYVINFQK